VEAVSGQPSLGANNNSHRDAVGANYGPGVEAVSSQPSLGANNDSRRVAVGANYGPGVGVVSSSSKQVLTTTPRELQANNYRVVIGQVYQFRHEWILRYAAVESDDKYGGSFTLIADNLDNLKDGQMVRVEGSVLPSDVRANALYKVSRFEVIVPKVN
jgi:hypothetical protein